jgi:hypothetical protein
LELLVLRQAGLTVMLTGGYDSPQERPEGFGRVKPHALTACLHAKNERP